MPTYKTSKLHNRRNANLQTAELQNCGCKAARLQPQLQNKGLPDRNTAIAKFQLQMHNNTKVQHGKFVKLCSCMIARMLNCKPVKLWKMETANCKKYRKTNIQNHKTANPPTCKPAKLQSCKTAHVKLPNCSHNCKTNVCKTTKLQLKSCKASTSIADK